MIFNQNNLPKVDYMKNCPICLNSVKPISSEPDLSNFEALTLICERCNTYILDGKTKPRFNEIYDLSEKMKLIISNEIFHNYQKPKIITPDIFDLFLTLKDKDKLEKMDLLLFNLNQFLEKMMIIIILILISS
jgi:hypothetical protein